MPNSGFISRSTTRVSRLLLTVALLASGSALSGAVALAKADPPSRFRLLQATVECIAGGAGYLKVSLTGEHEYNVDWPNAGTVCHGAGTRLGVGVNFGRSVGEGKSLTVGFTIQGLAEGETSEGLAVDVSIGGEAVGNDLYRSPRGACTVDVTRHELLHTAGARTYLVAGRGSCEAPAAAMMGDGEIVIGEFEFLGRTDWAN